MLFRPVYLNAPFACISQSSPVPYQKGDKSFDDFDWAKRPYKVMQAYFDSRLAQLLFAFTLNQKFEQSCANTRAISMQLGLVKTESLQNAELGGLLMKALAQLLDISEQLCGVKLKV